MTCKLLNSVVDSLDIRIGSRVRPSAWLLEEMEQWRMTKSITAAVMKPSVVELPMLGSFSLLSHGSSPYEFILCNPEICDIRIINPGSWSNEFAYQTGQFYLNFRSKFMQYNGIKGAVEFAHTLRALMMDEGRESGYIRVSRVDLAADIQLDEFLAWEDLQSFVSKSRMDRLYFAQRSVLEDLAIALDAPQLDNKGGANHKTTTTVEMSEALRTQSLKLIREILKQTKDSPDITQICKMQELETIYFGRFESPLYARIYNKSTEVEVSRKGYMKTSWKSAGWDGVSPVARVEFSLSGDFLRHLGCKMAIANGQDGQVEAVADMRGIDACAAILPNLWQYLTHNWLRHCLKGKKGQQQRWETSEFWKVVQGAWESAEPVQRLSPVREPEPAQLVSQITGCLRTAGAMHLPGRSLEEAINAAMELVLADINRPEFISEVSERASELGYDPLSDTAFSAQIRRERIREGFGS